MVDDVARRQWAKEGAVLYLLPPLLLMMKKKNERSEKGWRGDGKIKGFAERWEGIRGGA